MDLAVILFKYQGYRSVYKAEHVNAVCNMLKDHLTIPHRVICITDDPEGVNCETYQLWYNKLNLPRGVPNNYRCLKIFEIAEEFGERCLVLDLDILIQRNIDHLMTDDSFKILKGRAAPYNSSIYLFDSAKYKHVWSEFDKDWHQGHLDCRVIDGRQVTGSDQAWISYKLPNMPTWDRADGIVSIGDCVRSPEYIETACMIQFAGGSKPWRTRIEKLRNKYINYLKYYGINQSTNKQSRQTRGA